MFFKMLPPSSLGKEIPKTVASRFKQINWTLNKPSSPEIKLSPSAQIIVNELENTSSCDVPPAPMLKK